MNSDSGTPEPPTTRDNLTRRVLPGRERRVTEKGHSWQSQVLQDAKARAQRGVKQKRKAEAEARPNSKAPGPIDTSSKRRKVEWSEAIDESILRTPYEDLATDIDREKWYRAAIYRRDGKELPQGFDLVELKEMFDDPDAAGEGAQPPKELEDEIVTILPWGDQKSKSTPRSNSNSAGPTRKVARPSDPRLKPPNQSSIAQKPKPSNGSSTRSAKHRKSRHKDGRRAEAPRATGLQRQPAEDKDEGEGEDIKGGTSSRGSHKLRDFGELSWLVQAVGVRIKIRALKANPYADFTIRYSEPDENGEMHPDGYIFDKWLTEEWRRVWRRRHPNDHVPRMQRQHVKWLYDRLSKLRNGVKAVVSPKINHAYNLNRKKTVEENKTTVQHLGVDAFLSPTLTEGDCCAFQHPIFQEVIQDAFFPRIGKSFGYKHPEAFKPVPMGVYGLIATMIYVCIQEYATGIQISTDLKGEEQLPWYEMFIGIYEDIEEYNYQKLENARMRAFDESYGISTAPPPPRRLPVPPRKFGPDTQEVYHSRIHLSEYNSGENMPFAKPTAELSGSDTTSAHSSRGTSMNPDSREDKEFSPTLQSKSSNAPVEELAFTDESSD